MTVTADQAAMAWSIIVRTIEAEEGKHPLPYSSVTVNAARHILSEDLDVPIGDVWDLVKRTHNSND